MKIPLQLETHEISSLCIPILKRCWRIQKIKINGCCFLQWQQGKPHDKFSLSLFWGGCHLKEHPEKTKTYKQVGNSQALHPRLSSRKRVRLKVRPLFGWLEASCIEAY